MLNKRLFFPLFLACLALTLLAVPAFAVPPLPSSFYGQIKVNGQNVPDGTVVQVLIGGKAFPAIYSSSKTYLGNSVYSLDVPGDDPSTPEIEGGVEGDTIQFTISGQTASQTGVWHSGTNTKLDLTASSPYFVYLPVITR